ncbi:MAG: aminotransferase [Rhodospirillales bacterium]|nr:aminotransferase [Rhodospirillales bacterium]
MDSLERLAALAPVELRSEALVEKARRHLIQPWPVLDALGVETRTLLSRSEGVYVYDERGRRLLDGPAGMWCVQIGHRRPEMAEAIAEQVMSLPYYSPWYTTTGPAAELAAKIAGYAPDDLDFVFFTTGGSTAVDTALRFVQFYNNLRGRPRKKLILSRQGAYHGSTYLTATCCGKPRDKGLMDQASDIVRHLSAPYPYRRPAELSIEAFCDFLVEELESTILELGPERVACFLAEPILASGGVIVPPEGYHRRMEAVCRKYDVLTISDEVVTGFGRLGHMFASEAEFGLQPDMIAFAKGVTSGYVPLGGVAISRRLIEELKATGNGTAMFSNGYTYSSHPVACAAALKNIEIIEREGLNGHVRAIAPYFQARLQELSELPIVGEVRGMGLMACVECVSDRSSREPLALDQEVGRRIDRHCQELGLIVRPMGHLCVMSPPLIITRAQIDEMVAILREGIERTQADLRREGLWSG